MRISYWSSDVCSSDLEEELHKVRFEFDPAPALETLMLHFCGEVRLNHWYRRASDWHTEPVIKAIYKIIAQDEARHAGAYLRYMKRALIHQRSEEHTSELQSLMRISYAVFCLKKKNKTKQKKIEEQQINVIPHT